MGALVGHAGQQKVRPVKPCEAGVWPGWGWESLADTGLSDQGGLPDTQHTQTLRVRILLLFTHAALTPATPLPLRHPSSQM